MSTFDSKIFKAYDIRGIYPDQLNEEAAYWIGRAFGNQATGQVVVGRDMRLSSPQLHQALIEGIADAGRDVVDIGLVPIDAVYFTVCNLGYDAGIMVTASHNPKEYNGFKMMLKAKVGLDIVRGVELKDEVEQLAKSGTKGPVDKRGSLSETDVYDQYIKHVMTFCDPSQIKPLKVVVDAGNGMAGEVMPRLIKLLPIEMIPMNFELDGNFPAHPSNPLMPESQVGITKAVKKHKADLGVIIDGDTDRLFFVDETGEFIRADITLLLLAKLFLERESGSGIVYNVICSRLVPELIQQWGGKPIRSKVGFANISQEMKDHNGSMGGELSGHYAFRDNCYSDSGFIALVTILEMLSKENKPMSQVVKPFEKYYKIPETNLEIEDAEKVISQLKDKYTDGKQDELDGLTVSYPTWWFNVRASQTEPLLRVTLEGEDKEFVDAKLQELLKFIKSL